MSSPYRSKDYRRQTLRLRNWDYRNRAWYFVTICTHERRHLFDNPVLAAVAEAAWRRIPTHPHAAGIVLDEWVLMPNHLHGLLVLPGKSAETEEGDQHRPLAQLPAIPVSPLLVEAPEEPFASFGKGSPPSSLSAIVGNYKSVVSRRIGAIMRFPAHQVWQRGFYERIIRSEQELERVRRYIQENPARWAEDRENLDALLTRMAVV